MLALLLLSLSLGQDRDLRPHASNTAVTSSARVALVVGNSRYEDANARLDNPVGDAALMARTLRGLGFEVIEATDLSLGRLLAVVEKLKGAAIVTADHGNADQMFQLDKKGGVVRDEQGRPVPHTAHTLNPVPFWVYAPHLRGTLSMADIETRRLSNIAASALTLMGYEAPADLDPPLFTIEDDLGLQPAPLASCVHHDRLGGEVVGGQPSPGSP